MAEDILAFGTTLYPPSLPLFLLSLCLLPLLSACSFLMEIWPLPALVTGKSSVSSSKQNKAAT